MRFNKDNMNLYFVSATIGASMLFYLGSIIVIQQDIMNGSSLKMAKEKRLQEQAQ